MAPLVNLRFVTISTSRAKCTVASLVVLAINCRQLHLIMQSTNLNRNSIESQLRWLNLVPVELANRLATKSLRVFVDDKHN